MKRTGTLCGWIMLGILSWRSTALGVCNLDFVDAALDEKFGVHGLNGASAVAVSTDGLCVYAAGKNDDAVAVFLHTTDCELQWVEQQVDDDNGITGLAGASGVAVSPDGDQVYATGAIGDALIVFDRNPSTCALSLRQILIDDIGPAPIPRGLKEAAGVTVSPDGNHVYTVGETDDAVSVFARDVGLGLLTFVETHNYPSLPLNGARAVAVSPDGGHVYVAAFASNAVVVFNRNVSTGRLTFAEAKTQAGTGSAGLNGATSVALSLDGANVYVVGYQGDSIVAFGRNQSTGLLTLQGTFGTGIEPRSVIASPDTATPGGHVYVALSVSDELSVFRRRTNELLMALQPEDDVSDNRGGIDGLDGASAVTVSADAQCLYVASHDDDAIAIFHSFDPSTVTCNDSNPCTELDSCDGAGACTGAPAPAGTACDDSQFCTFGDTCDGGSSCVGGPCQEGIFCNGCTLLTCQLLAGVCGCAVPPP